MWEEKEKEQIPPQLLFLFSNIKFSFTLLLFLINFFMKDFCLGEILNFWQIKATKSSLPWCKRWIFFNDAVSMISLVDSSTTLKLSLKDTTSMADLWNTKKDIGKITLSCIFWCLKKTPILFDLTETNYF